MVFSLLLDHKSNMKVILIEIDETFSKRYFDCLRNMISRTKKLRSKCINQYKTI